MCIHLSIHPSIHLSIYPSPCNLSPSLSLSLSLSLPLSSLSLSPYMCVYVYPYICVTPERGFWSFGAFGSLAGFWGLSAPPLVLTGAREILHSREGASAPPLALRASQGCRHRDALDRPPLRFTFLPRAMCQLSERAASESGRPA